MNRVINFLRRIWEIVLKVWRKIGAAKGDLSPEEAEPETEEAETRTNFWDYPLHKSVPMPPKEFGLWLIATLRNKHNNIKRKRNGKEKK